MKLYHGTNQDIEVIDLTKGLAYKDFGRGFYLTPEELAAGLQDKFLDQQYYFGTNRALTYLTKTRVIRL